MKSIIVKTENNGVALYTSGAIYGYNEDGTSYEIKETDEEMMQRCYNRLINDVERKEFDKNMIALLKNHLGFKMDKWEKIQIKITGNWNCEMNILKP